MLKLEKTLLTPEPNPWSYSVSGLILVISLVLSLLTWSGGQYASAFSASRDQIFVGHEYWRLFTTIGVHGDLKHYLSNAFFFWIFGFLLNSYFGFFVFPVLSLIAGALVNYLTLASYPAGAVLVGASGVVYFMAAFWATLYFCIERGTHPLKRIMAVIGVSLILFFPNTFEAQVSYAAHAWGFGVGVVLGFAWFELRKTALRAHEVWTETHPELEPWIVDDEIEIVSDETSKPDQDVVH